MGFKTAAFIGAGLFITSVGCANAMTIRGGEWEVTMKMGAGDASPIVRKFCYASDMPVTPEYLEQAMSKMAADCSKPDVQISGNTMQVGLVCKIQQMTLTSKSTMTFEGDSAYHTDSQTHTDNAMKGMPADMTMSQDGKRLGPCQPGDKQAPGFGK